MLSNRAYPISSIEDACACDTRGGEKARAEAAGNAETARDEGTPAELRALMSDPGLFW